MLPAPQQASASDRHRAAAKRSRAASNTAAGDARARGSEPVAAIPADATRNQTNYGGVAQAESQTFPGAGPGAGQKQQCRLVTKHHLLFVLLLALAHPDVIVCDVLV